MVISMKPSHPQPLRFGDVKIKPQEGATKTSRLQLREGDKYHGSDSRICYDLLPLQTTTDAFLAKANLLSASKTGVKARISQTPGAKTSVHFLDGKGGLAAVITTKEGLTYIARAGSKLEFDDTYIDWPGEWIQASPAGKAELAEQQAEDTQTEFKQGMILGAGLASRSEPSTGDSTGFPKPGLPLKETDSIITGIARQMYKHGIRTIIVNTFYKRDVIKSQLDALKTELPGIQFKYIDEPEPTGTAGGLTQALMQSPTGAANPVIDRNQPLLIVQGDAATNANFSNLFKAYKEHHALVTIGGKAVGKEDRDKFGFMVSDKSGSDKESGWIRDFVEKPMLETNPAKRFHKLQTLGDSRLASTGFYVISPEAYERIETQGRQYLEAKKVFDYANDIFPTMQTATTNDPLIRLRNRFPRSNHPIPAGKPEMWVEKVTGFWSDIGNFPQYIQTLKTMGSDLVDKATGIIYAPGTRGKVARIQAEAKKMGTPYMVRGNVFVTNTPDTAKQLTKA